MPLPNLQVSFDYTFQQNHLKNRRYNNYFVLHQGLQDALNPSDPKNTFYLANELRSYKTINLYSNYNVSISDVHNFEAVIGFNQEDRDYESIGQDPIIKLVMNNHF